MTRAEIRLLGRASALGLLLFAAAELTNAPYNAYTHWYSFDDYQMFDAAHEARAVGLPRIPSLPNSAAGLDLLEWSHVFPPLVYAWVVLPLGIPFEAMEAVWLIELIALTALAALAIARQVPPAALAPLLLVVVADPLFRGVFVVDKVTKWSGIFAIATYPCLALALTAGTPRARAAWAFLLGLAGSLALLSFVAIGLVVLAGLSAALAVETWVRRDEARSVAAPLWAGFGLGAAGPLLAVGAYLAVRLGADGLRDVALLVGEWGSGSLTGAGPGSALLRGGYFAANLLVPISGPSVLPIALAATALNALRGSQLDAVERRLTRVAVTLALASLAVAAALSSYIPVDRLTWLLPILLPQLPIALRSRGRGDRGFEVFVVASALVVTAQAIFHGLGTPRGAAGMAVAGGAALALSALAACGLALPRAEALRASLDRQGPRIVIAALLLPILPSLAAWPVGVRSTGWLAELRRNLDHLPKPEREPTLLRELAAALSETVARELRPGDRVLTNAPMRELFGDGIRRQSIFLHRGLLGGATSEAADRIFVFRESSRPALIEQPYEGLEPGRIVEYRGFTYRLARRLELPGRIELFVGSPAPAADGEDVILPVPRVADAELQRFLLWRRQRGLPID